MKVPIDPQMLRTALMHVDVLGRDAGVLARSVVPGAADAAAGRQIDDLAAQLRASTNAALGAFENLGLDTAMSAPLRAVRDGATLVNAGPSEHVAFAQQVADAAGATRAQLTATVDAGSADAARAALLQRPREVAGSESRGLAGLLGSAFDDPSILRTTMLDLVQRDHASLATEEWRSLKLMLEHELAARSIGISTSLSRSPDAIRTIDAVIQDPSPATRLAAASWLDQWKLELDGTFDDPLRARAALRERLEHRADTASIHDLFTIQRLVRAADVGPDAPGLNRNLPDSDAFDDLVEGNLVWSRAAPADASQYLETWLAQLNGDTSTDDRLRTAIQQIVTKRPSDVTPREWMRLRVLAEADQRSATPILTRELQQLGRPVDSILAGFVDGDIKQEHAQAILGTWRTDTGLGFAVPEAMALIDGKLPAHVIRRGEVDAYLQGSGWPYTVFHGNSNQRTFEKIVRNGADPDANKRSMVVARAFYSALEPGGWGDTTVEVAVRLDKPFIVTQEGLVHALRAVVPGVAPSDKAGIRDALVAAGYDGILLQRTAANAPDWLIALKRDKIRVVVEDAPGAPDVRAPTPRRIDPDAVAANLRAAHESSTPPRPRE